MKNSYRGKRKSISPSCRRRIGTARTVGPFIGSGSLVIMRDPDGGWINASIYRVQVHHPEQSDDPVRSSRAGTAQLSRGNTGIRGNPVRSPWLTGRDPALFIAGFEYLPEGQSEYDFAGAIKGEPIDVLNGPLTGLPVPAQAESILEGELLPASYDDPARMAIGEFTGYYAATSGLAQL